MDRWTDEPERVMERGKILVVEDNTLTRKMVRALLTGEGHLVLEARDGRTALELMAAQSPDLIFQDLHLPDMDGFQLVARLRALPRGSSVRIIACSACGRRLEEAAEANMGFDDFLLKPLEPADLLRLSRAHVSGALPAR